jgi:hypothetical protein
MANTKTNCISILNLFTRKSTKISAKVDYRMRIPKSLIEMYESC